jgi:hypothetical protein
MRVHLERIPHTSCESNPAYEMDRSRAARKWLKNREFHDRGEPHHASEFRF